MTEPAVLPLHDELRAIDAARLWHPFTQYEGAPAALPIARAVGACLYDHLNTRYLDAISSGWTTLHGHAHPMIASAIAEQAHCVEHVTFSGLTHEPAARLAEQLVALLPGGLKRVFFSDNGSTAVEAALKMALQYWTNRGEPRKLIVALEGAYHGETFGAMAVSARRPATAPFRDHFFKVVRLPDPSLDEGEAAVARLQQLLEHRGKNVAALIVEPLLMGRAGMRVWEGKTLRAFRQLTEEHGVLLIADEALTGFGRTGPLFACGGAEVVPDIMCLSNGLTGGFLPLGATVAREEVFAGFLSSAYVGSADGGGGNGAGGPGTTAMFMHGHAYTANPIACAAARASLTVLDEESARRRAVIEEVHRGQIAKLASHPAVKLPRVLGTLAAFEVALGGGAGDDASGQARTPAAGAVAPEGAAGEQGLGAFALKLGVLLEPIGNVVYVLPPYCMSPEDLAEVWAVIGMWLEVR